MRNEDEAVAAVRSAAVAAAAATTYLREEGRTAFSVAALGKALDELQCAARLLWATAQVEALDDVIDVVDGSSTHQNAIDAYSDAEKRVQELSTKEKSHE